MTLSGDHAERVDPDWWIKFVTQRIHREAPIPADKVEREFILFRVIADLFGGSPTPEEAAAFLADQSPDALNNLAKLLSNRHWQRSVTGKINSGELKFRVVPNDPAIATRPRVVTDPGFFNLADQVRLSVSRQPQGEQIANEASITWYPPGKDNITTKVRLPREYGSWAAGWAPGATVLWVIQKDQLRSYDFTDNANVKEARYEGDQIASAPIPADVHQALRDAMAQTADQKPAPRPPAASATTN